MAIEYGSDVLIGLQFEGMDDDEKKTEEKTQTYKKQDPRQIQLKILKNRSYKLPDEPLNFDYYPKFNYFEDVD